MPHLTYSMVHMGIFVRIYSSEHGALPSFIFNFIQRNPLCIHWRLQTKTITLHADVIYLEFNVAE